MEQEKKGELVNTSLEFEYLHRKSRCENLCWLMEMTLVVTSLPLACVFNVCSQSCSFPLCAYWRNLTAQSLGATGELEVEFKLQRHSCKLSFLPSLLATVTMQLKLGQCLPSGAYCHYILVLWPITGPFLSCEWKLCNPRESIKFFKPFYFLTSKSFKKK